MSHNASIQSVNDSLFSSLQSSDRAEPGQLSFLDTEFFLGERAELTRVSAAAIPDRPLGEYSSFQRFVKAFDSPGAGAQDRRSLRTAIRGDVH